LCNSLSDGEYIIAGESGSNDGDVTGNHGMTDYLVVKHVETQVTTNNHIAAFSNGYWFVDTNDNHAWDTGDTIWGQFGAGSTPLVINNHIAASVMDTGSLIPMIIMHGIVQTPFGDNSEQDRYPW